MATKTTVNPRDKVLAHRKKLTDERAKHRAALVSVLKSIPKLDPGAIEHAVDELMAAADNYLMSRPLVDDRDHHSVPTVAEARRAMAQLHRDLTKAQQQLANLPLNAKHTLSTVYEAQNTASALSADRQSAMRLINAGVERILSATAAALTTLKALPDKTPDYFRVVLAYQVAVVFVDVLKLHPSSTLERQLKENNPRGGAAYDRVLRATLKAAKVDSFDSGPLVSNGLKLLQQRAESLPKKR